MNLIPLEPARALSLSNWWLKPESQEALECLEKSRQVALLEACKLQSQAKADSNNPQFVASATEKLVEAADFETTIRVLKNFFPDGPFVARIEL